MSTINSRPIGKNDLSQGLKDVVTVSGNRTNYAPLQMTDKTVFELAQHYHTLQEIADYFSVNIDTVQAHHGEAFKAGKAAAKTLPRFIMHRYFQEINAKESLTALDVLDLGEGKLKYVPAVDLMALKGMMELHAKKYEGMGSKTEVHHTGAVAYDAVESQPMIIERPSDD